MLTDAHQKKTIETTADILQFDGKGTLPPLMNPKMLEASDDLTNLSHLNEPAGMNPRTSSLKTWSSPLSFKQSCTRLNSDMRKMKSTLIAVSFSLQRILSRVSTLYTFPAWYRSMLARPGRRRHRICLPLLRKHSRKVNLQKQARDYLLTEVHIVTCFALEATKRSSFRANLAPEKTVSAKYIMRYFATRESPDAPGARSRGRLDVMSETEQQILATNPIMEAFGNAKTTRNDNSSRFGKYIEIMFDRKTDIIGARIRTYLLERSRLVFQPLKERNYHIFYQLLAGATDAEREELGLLRVGDFNYMGQGGDPNIDGVDDKAEFDATRSSLLKIGIPTNTQHEIFKLLAALLHLGNIKINATRSDSSLSSTDSSLVKACGLLGIDAEAFARWTVKKQLVTRGEKIMSNLTQQQAMVVRDSVAKFIYSCLFDWLVEKINESLATQEVLEQTKTFIGVLDIYGFEHFAKNSFEQFCINYANEKLQQEFNAHVFKLEQEEYLREEIDWKFIDFADNQPCIDLIEGKLGVLSLLDEESRLPMGSDDSFVTKLHHNFAADKSASYKKPRFGKSAFTVCHYALDVTYESDGFIDKNRDTVPDEQQEVLKSSANPFLIEVIEAAAALREKEAGVQSQRPGAAAVSGKRVGGQVNRKPTLGGIFKSSLIELMNTINSTDVHYIRCIKPNEAKEAWKFEGPMVLSQLRACGVLETIRISTAGYPTRWTYEEFALRYYMLVHSAAWTPQIRNMADTILSKAFGPGRVDKYQLGKTKIFFRAGMLAMMENLRTARLNEAAIMIQKNLLCRYYRRRYLEAREAVILGQALFRGFLARRKAEDLRQNKAATNIQRVWRGTKDYKKFQIIKKSVTRFDAIASGFLCRRDIMNRRLGNAARTIQRSWRRHQQMRTWRQYRRKVVIVQSLWRGKSARRGYKKLREEARDLKQISYKLENKVVELTQALGAMKRENKELKGQIESYEGQLRSWKSQHGQLDSRVRELQADANQAGIVAAQLAAAQAEYKKLEARYNETETLRKQVVEESISKNREIEKKNLENNEVRKNIQHHETEKLSLKQQLADLQDQLDLAKRSVPVNGDLANGNPAQPLANGLINLVSSKKPKRRSMGERFESNLEGVAGAYNPRPVSLAAAGASFAGNQHLSGATLAPGEENIELELENILAEEDMLNDEVAMGLIRNLKIPSPHNVPAPTEKEVLFPAYLINLVTSEMWNNGFVKESERFLANVMQSIQQEVMQHDGEEAVNPGAFWLSNVHEMLSFVFLAEDWYETQKTDNFEYDRLLEIVKHDLESLEFNIYHTWMKVLKKKLHKMIVPAIIESQSLPGFVTNENNRFLGKLLQGSNAPAYSMDNLLSLLNNVFKAMKSFYLEDSIVTQAVTELLRLVGVTAFNDLLMRRNFLSWKRGLQINYNITRIEEWCKSHDMPEGTLQLEHLMQATKLLQLKKATLNDIEIIQDICWMLSPNQIQKLLNQYLVADYEQPINGEIMKAVASRVTEKSDMLLLTAVDIDDSGPYEIAEPRAITALETYTPSCKSCVPIVF